MATFAVALPRFQPETMEHNRPLAAVLRALAADVGGTPAQLALAWLCARGVVPIPGTRRLEHLEQNVVAAALELSPEVLRRLQEAFPPGVAAGARYPEAETGASRGSVARGRPSR